MLPFGFPSWIIQTDHEYDHRTPDIRKEAFCLSTRELDYVRERSIDIRLNAIFGLSPTTTPNPDQEIVPVRKIFFDPPNRVVSIDDYIRLSNIREVIFEVVPDVYVKREGENFILKVYRDFPFAKPFETLVLVDGVVLTRHNELLELPPDRISSIEVKDKLYIHGNSVFSGIVNFISANRDFAGLDLPEKSILSSMDLLVVAEVWMIRQLRYLLFGG